MVHRGSITLFSAVTFPSPHTPPCISSFFISIYYYHDLGFFLFLFSFLKKKLGFGLFLSSVKPGKQNLNTSKSESPDSI
ncbi:hypothetical protein BDW42DRAFT_176433 [Aspergillus taichungensis]|uniref:Uncharacterized protein n=1 Tax=Aspergillus taichungensis TaxID=482145 RepID=A0A2J5HKP5_9EURO|nr:hypothetical protein BDW42DRAFT_176433 [Aspergillus taichungensis]